MFRISTAAGRALTCLCTQFVFVTGLTLLFSACHCASAAKLPLPSAGPCAITLAIWQSKQKLDAEIQAAAAANQTSPSQIEQLVWTFVTQPSGAPRVISRLLVKNTGQTKLNFSFAT